MKTVIFGGTTEGRMLSRSLADAGVDVTVSVVSEYGARQQGKGNDISLEIGAKTREEMVDMLRSCDLVVDATHPFAVEATANIRLAAEEAGVRRIRLCRDDELYSKGDGGEEIVTVKNREEAIEAAEKKALESGGNILLTTGVRDIEFYCSRGNVSKIYARVLPSEESIRTCMDSGMDMGNIIAIQGPFSQQLNEAIIREYGIAVLVTKESGRPGGFTEKLKACRSCGIPAVVISRPQEEGMGYEDVLKECLRIKESL